MLGSPTSRGLPELSVVSTFCSARHLPHSWTTALSDHAGDVLIDLTHLDIHTAQHVHRPSGQGLAEARQWRHTTEMVPAIRAWRKAVDTAGRTGGPQYGGCQHASEVVATGLSKAWPRGRVEHLTDQSYGSGHVKEFQLQPSRRKRATIKPSVAHSPPQRAWSP
jgi:hypothetical protein